MTLIDQLKQFDEMRGKEPINPQVIQEGPGMEDPFISPAPQNPPVPPEWLDDPEDGDSEPDHEPTLYRHGLVTRPVPDSPLIPPSVRRSPNAPASPQVVGSLPPDEIPDLLVIARGNVCAAAYKGKDVVLSEAGQKAVARIVLSEIMAGLKAEMGSVGIKRTRKRLRIDPTHKPPDEIVQTLPVARRRGRPRKVQA